MIKLKFIRLELFGIGGVFSATTTAVKDAREVSQRGICAAALVYTWYTLRFSKLLFSFLLAEDFANQVRFSTEYTQAVAMMGKEPGRFLLPAVAEYISGKLSVFSSINILIFSFYV